MKMKITEKMGNGKMKNGQAWTAGTGTKKRSMIRWGIAGFLVMGLLSGCSGTGEMEAQNQELKSRVESLSAEKESLEGEKESLSSELASVKDQKEEAGKKAAALQATIDEMAKEAVIQDGDVAVKLIGKEDVEKDSSKWIFNSYSKLKFEITNNTDKDIQGIEGKLKIMDLFGKEIIAMGCDFTGHTIPAGETMINDDLSFDINEFINDHMKFYTTAYEDLKSEYTVTQIVFTDGTVKE